MVSRYSLAWIMRKWHTLPQGQVRTAVLLGHSGHAPAWQISSQTWRPQASFLPQTRPHWKSLSWQSQLSFVAPHRQLYSPARVAAASNVSSQLWDRSTNCIPIQLNI